VVLAAGIMESISQPEQFAYDKSWDDIEAMLMRAELTLNRHHVAMTNCKARSKEWAYHARNYKALQGVVKTLRWTLGDKTIVHPLD